MDIHSLLDKYSGFQFWPITNKAAMNIHDLTFTWTYIFTALGCVPRSGMSGTKLSNCFTNWLYHFTFPPAVHKKFHLIYLLPILHIFILLHFGHSKRFVVISHFGFNWHFPSNSSCWASFSCSFAIHISIFLSIQKFPFSLEKKWLHLLLLEFWEYLDIICKSPLSYMWLANTFSQSIGCLKFADCLNFE